ncbi:NrfD/PsrC family molybdoenzyme membrane anchor subunit [Humibacillus xanthopallidus]|uniref:Polysulfide reductase NrfD n=1 Tax=Humibacillus xanthopallidus TaxID=412689 RepID=A0A543HG40_9MICO|nr:NrfD/PsrC family molybdoenzyme membrane anchor subunit [Humibacillus xanthopallidus]TQM57305.1 polysulfide reductase NrfD [Humibacillus xanthopallidus]
MTVNPFDADRPPERVRRGNGERKRNGQNGARRRDESLMVPDVSFDSYYGRHIVKPAPWEKEIAAYLFLGGVAGGSALLAAGGRALGYPALQRVGRVAAMGAAALGGAALAKDLGKPSRALNMMRTVKLTSPMSVGSWILTAFSGFSGLALASEVATAIAGRSDGGTGGGSAVARVARVLDLVDGPATVGSALFAPPLAAYTAVLLADTATPTWHESYRELPFVFVSSANLAAAGLALVAVPTAQNGPARRLAAVSAVTETLAFERMQDKLGPTLSEPLRTGKAGRLLRASKALTIGGAVGSVVLGRNRVAAALSGLALMAGSACLRFGVFEAGTASAIDPKYTVEPQRERLERRRAAGVVDDSITTAR